MSSAGTFDRALDSVRTPIVTVLAALGVRPNHLTLVGLAISGAAGYVVAQGGLLAGGALFLGGSLLDGLDGALARRTGHASVFGAFLDSVSDRVGEGLLLLGVLALALSRDDNLGAILAFVTLLASMMVSYTRARAEGLGLRGRGGFAPRPMRIAILTAGLLAGFLTAALIVVAALSAVSAFQRIMIVWRQTRPGGA